MKLTLEDIEQRYKPEFAMLLFGWMMSAAKKDETIANNILACANYEWEIRDEKFDNTGYFHTAKNKPKT